MLVFLWGFYPWNCSRKWMFTFYLYPLFSQSLLDLTMEPSVIHVGFYDGFYENFIPKIVLVSRWSLFICISYLFKASQPAWNVSEMSQSDLHLQIHLKDLSETSQKRRLFCGVFNTSQIHLKKDIFFEKSLRCPKYISKKMSFCELV